MNKRQYNDRLTDIVANAMNKLSSMDMPPNPSIIFDIDSTLINSISGQSKTPVITLYNYALVRGISPIIITARPGYEYNIEWTKEQLFNCEIVGYKIMYFRPEGSNDIWKYKEEARKNVAERGYNTVMSVGDQMWDIGKYGGVGVLVPGENEIWDIGKKRGCVSSRDDEN